MFELCGFRPSALPIINSRADQWFASALFLSWDRHILDGGARKKSNLIALMDEEELYKLIGVDRAFARARALDLVDVYKNAGYIDRFGDPADKSRPQQAVRPKSLQTAPREIGLEWLDQDESDIIVERRFVERREQKRDRRKAVALKSRYDNTCQFCGTKLEIEDNRHYSEAAHIKGLGEPHNGPDRIGNMLVLCPNHHLQFDRGILRLRKIGSTFEIRSKTAGDPLNGKRITLRHKLKNKYVRHHYDWFK